MGLAGIGDCHITSAYLQSGCSPYKMAIDLGSIATLESPKLLGKLGVERIGYHRHDNIEVNLDQYG